MGLFLLLWLLAAVIVFSIESVVGIYWYQYINEKISYHLSDKDSKEVAYLEKAYLNYSKLYSIWFVIITSFFCGIFLGWLLEKETKLLFRLNNYWKNSQPEFYRNAKGEIRVLLPWLLIELPLLIIVLLNIILIFYFNNDSYYLFAIFFFLAGFIFGQFIEAILHYKITIKMDRPEKPPEAFIHKITPKFPTKFSLLLGQIYCRVLLPLFFIYLLLALPSLYIFIPNYDNSRMFTIFIFIMLGVFSRWFYDSEDSFYFEKINLQNIFFLSIKLSLLIALMACAVVNIANIYLLIILSIICGFLLPWHPEKFRA